MLAHGAQQTSGSGSGSGSVQQSGSSSSNGLKGLSYAAGSAALSPGSSSATAATVTVRSGDSLSLIAQRALGSSGRWREIWNLNRAQVPNPNMIQVGMVLRLPAAAQSVEPSPQPAPTGTYVVRSGDTLSLIAIRLLGSASRWRELWEANRDRVPNPNFISVGMTLRVPGQASSPQPETETPAPEVENSPNDVRTVAMQITSVLETGGLGGYSALNDYDDGIISFGQHQATLASGSLEALLDRYLASSTTPQASALRGYMPRVRSKDTSLRNDAGFKAALRAAGNDPAMQAAQDAAIIQSHYNPAAAAAGDWNVKSPLGVAMLYDTKIQGGMETVLSRAQARVGGKPGQNNVTERAFLVAFNAERRARLIALAQARGVNTSHGKALMNSTYRCDEFAKLLNSGNLQLAGPITVRGVTLQGANQNENDTPDQAPDADPSGSFVELKKGDQGSKVQAVQQRLVDLNYMTQSSMNTGPGIFGPKTEASVRAFQQGEGLNVTGVVNKATHDRLQTADPRTSSTGFVHPTTSSNVTSPYGMRTHPISGVKKMHKGVDFGAGHGQPVYAVADGNVTVVGWDQYGYGNWIEIAHADGTRTRYAHLSSTAVSNGNPVTQGQTIGAIGSTGGSTGPHLHFEVRIGGNAVDPMPYLP